MYNCQSPQLSRDASQGGSITAKTVYINYSINILFHPVQKRKGKKKKKPTSCLKTRCISHAHICYHRSIGVMHKKIPQRSLPLSKPSSLVPPGFRQDVTQWKEEVSYNFSCPAAPLSNQGSRSVFAPQVTTLHQTTPSPLHAR